MGREGPHGISFGHRSRADKKRKNVKRQEAAKERRDAVNKRNAANAERLKASIGTVNAAFIDMKKSDALIQRDLERETEAEVGVRRAARLAATEDALAAEVENPNRVVVKRPMRLRKEEMLELIKRRRGASEELSDEGLEPITSGGSRPVDSVYRHAREKLAPIPRPVALAKARLGLPAIGVEQELIEAVLERDVLLVSGATGSGKSTQVPQFLYENGFCPLGLRIAITQPRRIAATALFERVGEEMGDAMSKVPVVGYNIRNESKNVKAGKLIFMTDGVLLRILQGDDTLSQYSVVVIDEAHERNLNGDLLMAMLTKVVRQRRKSWEDGAELPPLKLLIMSATLDLGDADNGLQSHRLWGATPKRIHVEGRTHPVVAHFARETPTGGTSFEAQAARVAAAAKKIMQIHLQLPPGTILVFMTGKSDISALRSNLEKAEQFVDLESKPGTDTEADAERNMWQRFASQLRGVSLTEAEAEAGLLKERREVRDSDASEDEAQAEYAAGDHSIVKEHCEVLRSVDQLNNEEYLKLIGLEEEGTKKSDVRWVGAGPEGKLKVFELLGSMDRAAQQAAFNEPGEDFRNVVIATNIAETSLTISNCRYVVDCGHRKWRRWDRRGVSRFEVDWISKASGDQRAGRAGRVGPGHCYRLYSSAKFVSFLDVNPVAMSVEPLDGIALYLYSMGCRDIKSFPFPSMPSNEKLSEAEDVLLILGAIKGSSAGLRSGWRNIKGKGLVAWTEIVGSPPPKWSGKGREPMDWRLLTTTGRLMTHFPMGPRWSRAVVELLARVMGAQDLRQSFSMGEVRATIFVLCSWCLGGPQMWMGQGNEGRAAFEGCSDELDASLHLLRCVLNEKFDTQNVFFDLTKVSFKLFSEIAALSFQVYAEFVAVLVKYCEGDVSEFIAEITRVKKFSGNGQNNCEQRSLSAKSLKIDWGPLGPLAEVRRWLLPGVGIKLEKEFRSCVLQCLMRGWIDHVGFRNQGMEEEYIANMKRRRSPVLFRCPRLGDRAIRIDRRSLVRGSLGHDAVLMLSLQEYNEEGAPLAGRHVALLGKSSLQYFFKSVYDTDERLLVSDRIKEKMILIADPAPTYESGTAVGSVTISVAGGVPPAIMSLATVRVDLGPESPVSAALFTRELLTGRIGNLSFIKRSRLNIKTTEAMRIPTTGLLSKVGFDPLRNLTLIFFDLGVVNWDELKNQWKENVTFCVNDILRCFERPEEISDELHRLVQFIHTK